jgi:hypothetical protein
MEYISRILKEKFPEIKEIDSGKLSHSGTGYLYPQMYEEEIVTFVSEGRRGYVIRLVMRDLISGVDHDTCFIIHERSGDSQRVCICGPEQFYYDCYIHDEHYDDFMWRLQLLLRGETILEFQHSVKVPPNYRPVTFRLGRITPVVNNEIEPGLAALSLADPTPL